MARLWRRNPARPAEAETLGHSADWGQAEASVGHRAPGRVPRTAGRRGQAGRTPSSLPAARQGLGGIGAAAASDLVLKVQPSSNEQKRLWELARRISSARPREPPDADMPCTRSTRSTRTIKRSGRSTSCSATAAANGSSSISQKRATKRTSAKLRRRQRPTAPAGRAAGARLR